jgi:hypothetical protein
LLILPWESFSMLFAIKTFHTSFKYKRQFQKLKFFIMICGKMEALEFKWPIHLCHCLVWQVDFRMLTWTQGLILSMFYSILYKPFGLIMIGVPQQEQKLFYVIYFESWNKINILNVKKWRTHICMFNPSTKKWKSRW